MLALYKWREGRLGGGEKPAFPPRVSSLPAASRGDREVETRARLPEGARCALTQRDL
jgi:hypothetical protein